MLNIEMHGPVLSMLLPKKGIKNVIQDQSVIANRLLVKNILGCPLMMQNPSGLDLT